MSSLEGQHKKNIFLYFSFFSGHFVTDNWGLSFIVPGILIAVCGFLIWLFMIVKPEDVGIDLESENPQTDTETSATVSFTFYANFSNLLLKATFV